jgi:hypothetical protein
MHHSEPDVMTRRFVGTGAVAYECGKLYNGQVPSIGILNHGSDKSALSECATGGTAGEHFGGVPDGIGADGAEAVATEESQRTPPIQRDCSQSPLRMIVVMIASQKRAARIRFARGFMMFENRPLWTDQMDHPADDPPDPVTAG